MSAHLSHKLPWGALIDVAKGMRRVGDSRDRKPVFTEADDKKLRHFARCLATAINEFRASDKSPIEEGDVYDPREWDLPRYSPFLEPFEWSILLGYVYLNLLLIDDKTFWPRIVHPTGPQYFFHRMAGYCDDGHPEFFANHFLQATYTDDRETKLRPLTADVCDVLRKHAAMMFRCMYTVSETNPWTDEEFVLRVVKSRLRW